AQIEAIWSQYGGPSIHLVWASVDGHIGHRLAGAIPRRTGSVGQVPELRWDGYLADADLPKVTDPAQGFVASANDEGQAGELPLSFPGFYASDDRILRLREVLAEAHAATARDSQALQCDVVS